MTSEQFREWRQQLGLSQAAAARALGLGRSTIIDYERGKKRGTDRAAPVPRVVELACQALQAEATG
jgi:transcriptional regulator with XRE-family HTH domain